MHIWCRVRGGQWGHWKREDKVFLIPTQGKGHERKCSNFFLYEEKGNQMEKANYVES